MAADQGHASAQFNLGVMYANGEGVAENDAEAYFWLSLAAATGTERDRQYRDEIKAQLTPGVVAEVQARTAAWRPKTGH
jgi:TPR repeat protein